MLKIHEPFLISDKKVGCKLCAKVLDELEKIDHEAQAEDIHIVKIDDKGFAKKYGIYSFPAVLFFQGPKSKPVVYAGKEKLFQSISMCVQVFQQ